MSVYKKIVRNEINIINPIKKTLFKYENNLFGLNPANIRSVIASTLSQMEATITSTTKLLQKYIYRYDIYN